MKGDLAKEILGGVGMCLLLLEITKLLFTQ